MVCAVELAARRLDPERLGAVVTLAIEAGRIASQARLAVECGMTPGALANLIAGRRLGKPGVAEMLAAKLGVPVMLITSIEPLSPAVQKIRTAEVKAVRKKRAAKRARATAAA